jgi:hypothetical protein
VVLRTKVVSECCRQQVLLIMRRQAMNHLTPSKAFTNEYQTTTKKTGQNCSRRLISSVGISRRADVDVPDAGEAGCGPRRVGVAGRDPADDTARTGWP